MEKDIKPRKFETKVVKLDGENNFITVKVIGKDKKVLYTLKKSKFVDEEMKITDFETARLLASKMLPNKEVKFIFHIDGNEFDASNSQKLGKYFQLYDLANGIKYYIEEVYNYNLYKTGYYVFQNGDTERYDKEYGFSFLKEELEIIKYALQNELIKPDSHILSIDEISKTEYMINMKGSTAKIYICTNSKFMDINQALKDAKCPRVIPYLKNMDKYLTLSIFSIVDRIYDKWFINSKQMIDSTMESMIEFVNTTQDEQYHIRYVETPYTGYVNLSYLKS